MRCSGGANSRLMLLIIFARGFRFIMVARPQRPLLKSWEIIINMTIRIFSWLRGGVLGCVSMSAIMGTSYSIKTQMD